jgi:hypothetical protein
MRTAPRRTAISPASPNLVKVRLIVPEVRPSPHRRFDRPAPFPKSRYPCAWQRTLRAALSEFFHPKERKPAMGNRDRQKREEKKPKQPKKPAPPVRA